MKVARKHLDPLKCVKRLRKFLRALPKKAAPTRAFMEARCMACRRCAGA